MDESRKIIPDHEAFDAVERKYPGKPPAEKYRLAQAEVLVRLAEYPTSMKELYEEVASGKLEQAIRAHNARMEEERGPTG